MRLIILSDSHGRERRVFDIINKHIDDANYFINLGDCSNGRDFENAERNFNKMRLISVCGNCDLFSTENTVRELTVNGKRIMLCHGHTYGVKHGLENLISAAVERKADIALFGHTHTPYCKYENGLYIFNPGAVCDGRYGIVDITESGIMCINAEI